MFLGHELVCGFFVISLLYSVRRCESYIQCRRETLSVVYVIRDECLILFCFVVIAVKTVDWSMIIEVGEIKQAVDSWT